MIKRGDFNLGFLKFLKKEKRKSSDFDLDSLDVPPMPPGLRGDFGNLPEAPKMEPEFLKGKLKDDFEDIPEFLKETNKQENLAFNLPKPPMNFGNMQKKPEDVQKAPKMDISGEEPKKNPMFMEPAKPRYDSHEYFERKAVNEERNILSHKQIQSDHIYLRVDKFKIILENIRDMKKKLKEGDDSLVKMHEIDGESNKQFIKWKAAMNDLQKKFIFVDKSLFKR